MTFKKRFKSSKNYFRDHSLEQISSYKYLGCIIGFNYDTYRRKSKNTQTICGTIKVCSVTNDRFLYLIYSMWFRSLSVGAAYHTHSIAFCTVYSLCTVWLFENHRFQQAISSLVLVALTSTLLYVRNIFLESERE